MPDLTQKDDDIVVVIDTETGELKPGNVTSRRLLMCLIVYDFKLCFWLVVSFARFCF